jgi:2-polyprenyl-3-methyl-5-hydroxy-6-metoxy-1,4-benzoquinol methylase
VSAFLATLGLTVTGIDLSPAMIEVQTNRAYVLARRVSGEVLL